MRLHINLLRVCSIGLGIGALVATAGLAPTPVTVRDRFTDNAINLNLWRSLQVGSVGTDEDNRRLEFYAMNPTGDFSYGGLGIDPWGANWSRDFVIRLDYKLNLPTSAVPGDRIVWVGVDMSVAGNLPETSVGYAAGVTRDRTGLYVNIMRFDGSGSGPVQLKTAPITGATSGTLEIEWDRSADRLTARVGGVSTFLTGPWSRYGAARGFHPMLLAVGCTTLYGDITFVGTRVFVDNFEFTGFKKGGCAGCH